MSPSKRFLIVDEVEANVLFFSVVLRDLGFSDVVSASNGNDGLAKAKAQAVQFVIVAWEMRQMSGTYFIQRLKTQSKRAHIPYLIYSKRMSEEDLRLTREMGLPNVLALPLDKVKAREAIDQILAGEATLSPVETKLRKIESLLEADRPTDALSLCDGSVRDAGPPHLVRAQTALGKAWFKIGNIAKAEAALNLALKEDPQACDAATTLAAVYSRAGRQEEAIQLLKRLSEGSPKNITTLLNLGSTYVEADRHDEARAVFATVSTLDPDNPSNEEEKGKLAFKEGDLPLAAKLLAESQNGDALARHFNNLAIGLSHAGKLDRAVETYENAIKLLSTKAKMHALRYNLGLALARKGDLERSFKELAQSYLENQKFDKAYAALARVAKQLKEQGRKYDVELARSVNKARQSTKAPSGKDGAAA